MDELLVFLWNADVQTILVLVGAVLVLFYFVDQIGPVKVRKERQTLSAITGISLLIGGLGFYVAPSAFLSTGKSSSPGAPTLIDTFYLSSDGSSSVSNLALQDNEQYSIEVEGMFHYFPCQETDCRIYTADGQFKWVTNREEWTHNNWISFDGLQRNADFSNKENHRYIYHMVGSGRNVTLKIIDSGYAGNRGGLSVRIYKGHIMFTSLP